MINSDVTGKASTIIAEFTCLETNGKENKLKVLNKTLGL